MIRRFAIALTAIALSATQAAASEASELLDAMGVPRVLEIMRNEGLNYGDDIARDLLSGPSPAWRSTISRIYDVEAMREVVEDGFVSTVGEHDIGPLLDFFRSEDGKRVVELELSAREAMVEDEVEESAREAYRALAGTDDDRLELVTKFVEANDLIESNVVGAMNSNYMFYRGLVDGGAFEMSEGDILSEVWGQEEETRADTREWVYGFLLMAYGPLDEGIVEDYVELSRSEAGKVMNRALFAGFDKMYGDLSYALGLAAAKQMQGQDL